MQNQIESYFNNYNQDVQNILREIQKITREFAPNAIEKISYNIPSFNENGVILYYAAFKNHFSIYPPIHGDEELLNAVKPYANEKGNLLFKYKNEIPWGLIEKVILRRIEENSQKQIAK